jgi:hypothetical protein
MHCPYCGQQNERFVSTTVLDVGTPGPSGYDRVEYEQRECLECRAPYLVLEEARRPWRRPLGEP